MVSLWGEADQFSVLSVFKNSFGVLMWANK